MADIIGPGAAALLANVLVSAVGIVVGVARGGLERRPARAFTLWMLFRLVMVIALYRWGSGAGTLWFDLWTYAVVALDFAFVAFALSWPRPRAPAWTMAALVVACAAYELVFLLDHCAVFCFQTPTQLGTGPLDFPEIFMLLYPAAGWLLARDVTDPRAQRGVAWLAAALVVLGAFYATNGSMQWIFQGNAASFVPGPWVSLIAFAQSSPVLAVVPGSVALARRLPGRPRAALLLAVVAALGLGVWQNLMPPLAANLTASAIVAAFYAIAVASFATTPLARGPQEAPRPDAAPA
jgi:hypothetical protein